MFFQIVTAKPLEVKLLEVKKPSEKKVFFMIMERERERELANKCLFFQIVKPLNVVLRNEQIKELKHKKRPRGGRKVRAARERKMMMMADNY